MRAKLHSLVFDLVEQTNPGDWRRIAETTELKFSWIRAFAENRIPHPSAFRLECLYQGITGKPIEFAK